jgi:predicted methyltransferase
VSEADDLKFGQEQFDYAILVVTYHDFFHKDEGWDFPPAKVIPQLFKSMKKGGKLLVIDHQAAKGAGKSVTKSLHRVEGSFVKQDIINRGFIFVKESSLLENDKDPLDISVFTPEVRRQTDRFVYLF